MELSGKRIIQLVEEDFEDLELWYPVLFLRGEGAEVIIAGKQAGKTYKGKYGIPAVADVDFHSIDPDKIDGILVPGGWAPDKLRRYPEVLNLIRAMDNQKKPIGQICHAGWVLISAGILKGRKVTSTPGIKDDMENAGGIWADESVVVDEHLVSSRRPADLPFYMKAFMQVLLRR